MGIQLLQRVVAFYVKALLDDVLLYTDKIGYGCDEFFGIDGHGIASVTGITTNPNKKQQQYVAENSVSSLYHILTEKSMYHKS